MNSHHATSIFVLVCCCGGVGRTVLASIVDGRYYGPYNHRIGGGYLYGTGKYIRKYITTGAYHRGPHQQYRNIGLIDGSGVGGSRLSLTKFPTASAAIATTATAAMPRHNYNRGLRPYENVIIPMSPYYWSPPRSGLLHRGNDHYRGRGSVSVIGKHQQQLFGGLIPKKTRKIVISGPGGHVSQTFVRPNTHYGMVGGIYN
ncbi:uncharacterized protein LOC113549529 isoform X1 [Rhopalosiphum maidis]|uniref:uncharacterized protein LOC113549529 isoform X1 n=1 Tax=Rhopalosiphum maidis TaxID=43146 RepID=UPI000EFF5C79|nr:uncharacterized protein LOC113549529 isoform X1 [Rhopalosiphum maidis]